MQRHHPSLFLYLIALLVIYFISIVFIGNSFAMGPSLKTLPSSESELTGGYSLILYGGRYMGDVETVAILVKDDSPYAFEPFAPDYEYKIRRGLSAERAIQDAREFVSMHPAFVRTIMSAVADPKGTVIAYEMRPLYMPVTYGISDVIDVDYVLKDNKVVVFVKAKRSVVRSMNGGAERSDRGGSGQ